ncbi:hypothetical protein [Tersicoccus solisilvae]|uniref:hypothetical protein n=1 Tax=Tersicoccus solisilvae TaxID=1882339 RepID=UPI00166CD9D7|nr:hypothetical protein [Tersicoccus solisilvae]
MAEVLSPEDWTLVGGLMVQLHLQRAGIRTIRPTEDIDMVAHIETDPNRLSKVQGRLMTLGYVPKPPLPRGAAAHRFERGGSEVIDLMVADHANTDPAPTLMGRPVVKVHGATGALQRTVNSIIATDPDGTTHSIISVPNSIAALGLKAAAYIDDRRDTRRHLDDAISLAATIADPVAEARFLRGHDRGRIRRIWAHLQDPDHPSWLTLDPEHIPAARSALSILTQKTQGLTDVRRLGLT